jgi:LmbE family N-acetylglucosaminyl deacetylase
VSVSEAICISQCLPPKRRIVVVSPHLDDAVLSLGATIASAVRSGADVEVLSVFCGDPGSAAPPGEWDRKSGFQSEGEASRVRREEDRAACSILGARPRWLPFGDEQYDQRRDEQQVGTALVAALAGADAVLIPGWPLQNADHLWLNDLLLRTELQCGQLGLYLEQPYGFYRRACPSAAMPDWHHLSTSTVDRELKRHAVSAYRSQARQLGLRFTGVRRFLRYEFAQGGEAVAWLPSPDSTVEELGTRVPASAHVMNASRPDCSPVAS